MIYEEVEMMVLCRLAYESLLKTALSQDELIDNAILLYDRENSIGTSIEDAETLIYAKQEVTKIVKAIRQILKDSDYSVRDVQVIVYYTRLLELIVKNVRKVIFSHGS